MAANDSAIAAAPNPKRPDWIQIWYLNQGFASFELEDFETLINPYASADQSPNAEEKHEAAHRGNALTNTTNTEPAKKMEPPFEGSWTFAAAKTADMVRLKNPRGPMIFALTRLKVYVFGVRQDLKVCMISPTYEPLPGATAVCASVAACGHTKITSKTRQDNVTVFYLA